MVRKKKLTKEQKKYMIDNLRSYTTAFQATNLAKYFSSSERYTNKVDNKSFNIGLLISLLFLLVGIIFKQIYLLTVTVGMSIYGMIFSGRRINMYKVQRRELHRVSKANQKHEDSLTKDIKKINLLT